MAAFENPYTVRSITVDGEFVSETETLDYDNAWATFSDTVEHAGAGICVQLISEDGRIEAEELTSA